MSVDVIHPEIFVQRPARDGKHTVISRYGANEVHRDSFAVDSAWHRDKFKDVVAKKVAYDYGYEEPLDWIPVAIVERAIEADAQGESSGRSPELVNLADVAPMEVCWLWPQRIALGKLTLLAGDPGEGKSFLSLDITSRVTRGSMWPDDSGSAPLGSVVLLCGEDDIGDTVRPRLDAAGADVSKVVALRGVRTVDSDGNYCRDVDLQRDLDVIEAAIAGTPDCQLFICDPIGAYLGETDTHNNSEVRRVLAPLSEMAARRGVAVVAVHHFRKGDGSAKHRVTGSLAFTAAARAVWAVTGDKNDPTGRRKFFVCVKNNLGPDQSGLAFELTSRWGDGSTPCICWEADPIDVSADEALSTGRKPPGPDPADREEAEAFLRDALADGPRPTKQIEEEAREQHDITKRTLVRARKALGVEAFREGHRGPWMLRLSHSATHSAT